jgi:catechol 1,2-dioxygenase
VDFVPRENDPEASLELNYDVKLVKDEASTNGE